MDASSGQYSFLGPKQLQFKSLISLLEYYKYASLAVLEGIHVYCCGDSKSKHWVKNGPLERVWYTCFSGVEALASSLFLLLFRHKFGVSN